ncbi:enoyl-CoA hydratase/isomerase family protein [Halobacillus litoralis]|uniref:enoyl-CoA hydratase/isomerase family protein n=1 Tax=Halobacillus litoralis TaxID=45668 RepID=UPI001CD3DEC7|nr:enoyl-CoA hydratase/isomerase family protein [Halobacillus litoralis]MCA1024293.1 enoyl-CoA hydratase/isomerase family protein [Halobacillus litoralis]
MVDESSVLTEVKNGTGVIKLNRSKSINSLNAEMVKVIHTQLQEWKTDERIVVVLIDGEGQKGLCAGGDMRTFYDLKESNVNEYAETFFGTEYKMDYEISHYPKPVVVYMSGIVMGGGVGLSIGAGNRIVTEKTKWAMPEMNIGFFPDVGVSYFLSKMPGYVGRYLALTAAVIKAEDVLYTGAADLYLESEKWPELKKAIENKHWTLSTVSEDLEQVLQMYCHNTAESSPLAGHQEKIDEHFQYRRVEEIVASLTYAAENGDEWAEQTRSRILAKSPTSLKVTLRNLETAKNKTLAECFQLDMILAMNFMRCHDFYEGVRAVLVDKDKKPTWEPAILQEVEDQAVDAFFHYNKWEGGRHPLAQLSKNTEVNL